MIETSLSRETRKPITRISTGIAGLDDILCGGLTAQRVYLVEGTPGTGKTTVSVRCLLTALERGEKASFYLFDEALGTFFARSASMDIDLRPYVDNGQLAIQHIDHAELAPGEFAQMLRDAVELNGVQFIAIDSLNAYLQAMPGEHFLTLQMHELLSYLNQQGITTVLVPGQHGLIGEIRTDIDLNYLSDTTVLLRFFESNGRLRRAIAVIKSRTSNHMLTIHELQLGSGGITIGEALKGLEGVLTGLSTYRGTTPMLAEDADEQR